MTATWHALLAQVEAAVISDAWAQHCDTLTGLTYQAHTVTEIAVSCLDAVRAAPFVTPLRTRGGLVQVFVLPLGRLTDEALNRTVTSPLTVFPILEFMQCVVRYVESKTVTRMSLRVAVHGFDAVTPLGLLGPTLLTPPRPHTRDGRSSVVTCGSVHTHGIPLQ